MMFIKKKDDRHSLAKIIFITSAVVLGVLAVLAVLCKLRQKYFICNCEEDCCIDEDNINDFVEIECEDDDPSDDLTLADNV